MGATTTSSAASRPSSRRNSAEPRLYRVNEYDDTIGDIALELAPTMGYELLAWQADLVRDMGAIGPGHRWAHPRCAMSIPRQQGKSAVLIVWVAVLAAVAGYKVLWTDHNYSTTLEMLARFRDIFGARPGDLSRGIARWRRELVEVCSQTGQEWMRFRSGGVIQFSTRTKSSRLGFSFDVVVYDEAQELTGVHTQVINPTTTSGDKHNLQLIYAGTPTRAGSFAGVFRGVRSQAWEGGEKAQDLLWLEYGVSEVGDIWDRRRWRKVMPSLGFHADETAIATGMKDMDVLGAAQEYLGYWLPGSSVVPAIDPQDWAAGSLALADAPAPAEGDVVCLAACVSADGAECCIAACVRPEEGPCHVELAKIGPMAEGVTDYAEWLAARFKRVAAVVVDGRRDGAEMVRQLESFGVRGKRFSEAGQADVGEACACLLEATRAGTVTHAAQPQLDAAALNCPRKQAGKSWEFADGADGGACRMEAAALALKGALGAKPRRKASGGKVRIGC